MVPTITNSFKPFQVSELIKITVNDKSIRNPTIKVTPNVQPLRQQ